MRTNPSNLALYILMFVIATSFLGACNTGTLEPEAVNLGWEYFPLETGRYIDYQVEDIQFSILNPPDTNRYQIRELIGEEFADINGDPSFRLERYRRANSNAAWVLDSVWQIKRNTTRAILLQNNRPLVKLVFPLEEGKEWKGTIFFKTESIDTLITPDTTINPQTQDTTIVNDTTIVIKDISDTYKVVNFNKPLTLGTFSFDSTLTVIQKDDSTLVNIDRRKEIYAANVGLVYKDSTVARYCDPSLCDFPVIEFGRKSRQIIIGYGKL